MKITSSSLKFTIGLIITQVLISITYFSCYFFEVIFTNVSNEIFPILSILTLITSIYLFNYFKKFLNNLIKSIHLNFILSIIIIYNFLMILHIIDFFYAGLFKLIDPSLFYKLYDLGSVLINLIYIYCLLKVKNIDYSKEIKTYAFTQFLIVIIIVLYYLFPTIINSNKKISYGISLLSLSPYISLLILYFKALNKKTTIIYRDAIDSPEVSL